MIGEHGFSQLAAFKAATIAGKSLTELQAENPDKYAFDHMEVEELARKGGYVTYQASSAPSTPSPTPPRASALPFCTTSTPCFPPPRS